MKRKSIKDSTIIIIGFCLVVFIAIMIIAPKRMEESDIAGAADPGAVPHWLDSLTNADSDYAPLEKMDKEVGRFMGKWNIRGMSISVSRNDSLLYTKGFGYADKEKGEIMQPKHIMRIASVSKLITAVAIMKLVEEGKLSLSSTVFGPQGILNNPEYTEILGDSRAQNITIENLLQHKGGFTTAAGDPMFNTVEIKRLKQLDHAPSNDELIKIVMSRKLGFEPGMGRKYSNFGYMLLSKVIEKVTGESYWDYVRTNILAPAGAYNMRPAHNYYEERQPDEVKYYSPDTTLVEDINNNGKMVNRCYGGANINALLGAGGWASSSADLSRLVASIDGNPHVKDILTKESIEKMTAHADDDKLSLGWSESDGMGTWTRTGTLASAHAIVKKFPNGECWVITMNTGVWTGFRFSQDLEELIRSLREKYSSSLPKQDLFISKENPKS